MRSLCWKYSLRFRRGCCLGRKCRSHYTWRPLQTTGLLSVLFSLLIQLGIMWTLYWDTGTLKTDCAWYVCSHFYAGVIFSTYIHMWESTQVQITKSDPGSAHICMSASFFCFVFFCNTLHVLCCRDATKHQICICILPLLQRTVTWVITCLCLQLFSVH